MNIWYGVEIDEINDESKQHYNACVFISKDLAQAESYLDYLGTFDFARDQSRDIVLILVKKVKENGKTYREILTRSVYGD